MFGIFDTHAHYDEQCFTKNLPDILDNQLKNGVSHIINCGSSVPSSIRSVNLAKKYDFVYAAVGVFPLEVDNLEPNWLDEITCLCKEKKVVAVGEIGLDYFNKDNDRVTQQKVFRLQLELAQRLNLPVQIHDRDADADTIKLVEEFKPKGLVHRFFSPVEAAKRFIELGLYLGIGCAVTYSYGELLIPTLKEMPLEMLVLETDCPFLPPSHLEGKDATSDMLVFAAERIAQIRGDVTAQQIVDITRENACRLYKIN